MQGFFDAVGHVWAWIIDNLMLINVVPAITIVFVERREPKTVWTWLLVLYFIPVLGFILYLVIGQDFHKSRMFKIKEVEDELSSTIRNQEENITSRRFRKLPAGYEKYTDLVLYNLESSGSVFTDDNKVAIYTDGVEKFAALVKEIEKAKEFIHLQYYIIKPDEVFEKIEEALLKKVREGVEVRILYDSMGCRNMRKRDWKRLHQGGICTAEFFPAKLKKLHLRINYRNHRKIVIIDGKVGFVGGFNVGKEYIGKDKYFKYWRDTHLKIEGSAVDGLSLRFILDWNYATKQNLFYDKYLIMDRAAERGKKGSTGIQIISSGPDSKNQNVRNNYLRIIHKAKKHIYIQTPYFIPDEPMLCALQIASMSGVDVKVMIPCKPDHPFVYWATYSYINDLLEAGIKCYTYMPGFLHAKGIMADGEVSSFGTANMDIRSFQLNFEVNAVIYNRETTRVLERYFEEDVKKCMQITPYVYAQRSLVIKVKEQISRLLSPIL